MKKAYLFSRTDMLRKIQKSKPKILFYGNVVKRQRLNTSVHRCIEIIRC